MTSHWLRRGLAVAAVLAGAGIALAFHRNDLGAILLAAAFMLGVVFLLFGNPRSR